MIQLVSNQCTLNTNISINNRYIPIAATNHFELIRSLLPLADAAFLVSPFLYEDFSAFFSGLDLNGTSVELVTTCAPLGTDQLKKPFSLRSFSNLAEASTGRWPTIGLDQALHSKIYIFLKNKIPFAGVVSSANLTGSGLRTNHETGVLLLDGDSLRQLIDEVRSNLDYVNISQYQIDKLCAAAEAAKKEIPIIGNNQDFGLKNILNNYCTPSAGNRRIKLRDYADYYIKVSGVSDKPILVEDQRAFDEPHCELSFAKSPNNIRLGDCLLEVAVGGMCFLSYYTCTSQVFERSKEEKNSDPDHRRWPYYILANNLSLHYGKAWFKKPLYYNEVVEKFKSKCPNVSVTKAGKDHFVGAIQLGHSYVRVTREFGSFVRREIDAFKC